MSKVDIKFDYKCDTQLFIIVCAAVITFLFSGLNSVIYSIEFAFDSGSGTYIFRGDLLADFFKVILSYPGADEVTFLKGFGLSNLIDGYMKNNPYQGIVGLPYNQLTHFHLTPLTTALSLTALEGMKLLGPHTVLSLLLMLLIWSIVLLSRIALPANKYWPAIFLIMLFSYPFLFLLQRGNFFSAISSLSVIFALVFLYKKKNIYLSIFLLALAINIRPNLALLAVPFLICSEYKIKSVINLLTLSTIIFTGSLYYSNVVYPDYNLNNFTQGLKIYHDMYVIDNGGFAYSTSLYTMIKFLSLAIHPSPFYLSLAEFIATTLVIFLISVVVILRLKSRIDDLEFIFSLVILNMLGTTVFADYHLLIFLLPLIILIILYDGSNNTTPLLLNKSHIIILISICIFLSPLNLFKAGGLFVLTFIKTLIGLAFILLLALRDQRPTFRYFS